MIRKQYVYPECYINKIPICDDCKETLKDTGRRLMSNPPLIVLQCPKCKREYNYRENELQGEWKWKTI